MSVYKVFRPVTVIQSGKILASLGSSKVNTIYHGKGSVAVFRFSRLFANSTVAKREIELGEDACPQGVQGDDCSTFKLWMDNCRRYGLQNCDEQLQGIQSGRKTLGEVLAEQDRLIADIAAQYQVSKNRDSAQGVQDGEFSAFPTIDAPCPQGIQGEDCERFKLWLENCHRFGIEDCMHQYTSFKAGRKTLAQIFTEQDKAIRAAVVRYQQRRSYSTSTRLLQKASPDQNEPTPDPKDSGSESTGQLSQRQRLQRAVKEYGSTVIVFHVTISLMSLGFFYVLVSSGIDVIGLLQKVGIGGTLLENKVAAGTGTFVLAYAVHKIFAPARIATTLTATPFIVRYLRRVGFLKAPKT